MTQGKVARALKNPRFRPYLLGILIGPFLGIVIWQLLAHRSLLGLLCLLIWVVLSCFWVNRPLYKTIWIAWFVGSFLGFVMWKP